MKSFIFCFFILLFYFSFISEAAVIRVPADQPTIQAGIDAASDGDTVLLSDGTFSGEGNRRLRYFGKAITVESDNSAENCVIDCEFSSFGFRFDNGETAGAVLKNLTIRNGKTSSGGGIGCYESSPIITGCIFENCEADQGGGINFYGDCSPMIKRCTFKNNKARWGGAICCDYRSSPVIGGSAGEGNRFEGNFAPNGADIASLFIPDEMIVTSYNSFEGYCYSDYYVSPQSAFRLTGSDNELEPILQDVYVSPAGDDDACGTDPGHPFRTIQHALSRIKSTVSNPITVHLTAGHYAPSVTGEKFPLPLMPYISLRGETASSTILDAEQTSNVLSAFCDYDVVINDISITGGKRNYGGGLFCVYSSPVFTRCVFSGNRSNWEGAAIFSDSEASLFFSQCLFTGNSSDYSTLDAYNYSSLNFSHCRIIDNDAPGIKMFNNSSLTLLDTIISENYSPGVVVYYQSELYAEKCTISGNSPNPGYKSPFVSGAEHDGGGIGCELESYCEIRACTIENNSAWYGGGISCGGSSCLIRNTTLKANRAVKGGGIILSGNDDSEITYCSIIENESEEEGGGIFCGSDSPVIAHCDFSGNTAEVGGGGIFLWSQCYPKVFNCIVNDNYAHVGGGICGSDSHLQITNCTINGNESDAAAGAVFYDCSVEILNSIIWENSPVQLFKSGGTLSVTHSDIQGGYPGNGNLETQPIFVTGPYGGYYLSHTLSGQTYDSPCIDSGADPSSETCCETSEQTLCLSALTTRSDELPDDSTADIGFHYCPSSLMTVTPIPSATPTFLPTGNPTPEFTPTAFPPESGVRLFMPSHYFSPGDECRLEAFLYNSSEPMSDVPLFVLLDISGEYWYWDEWTQDIDFNFITLPSGRTTLILINSFIWPDTGSVFMENLMFWGAMLDQTGSRILGGTEGLGCWTFGFGPG